MVRRQLRLIDHDGKLIRMHTAIADQTPDILCTERDGIFVRLTADAMVLAVRPISESLCLTKTP